MTHRQDFETIGPGQLRRLTSRTDESRYTIVDVRRPDEYAQGHIPGALLIPLDQLEGRLSELSPQGAAVFYCRSGARSAAAARLAAGSAERPAKIYNLSGGIRAWEGRKAAGFPRLQALPSGGRPEELLYRAMDLEKGAWRFYRRLAQVPAPTPAAEALARMQGAEREHAARVYRHWRELRGETPAFPDLFEQLAGDILEGGRRLEEVFDQVTATAGDRLGLLELAMDIECSAYDLYRAAAHRQGNPAVRGALLEIAQAEKAHMRLLAAAIAGLPAAG